MSKEAQLEAILYLAGDEGITEDQLSQLLDIPALQLHEIIKKTKDKLEDDHDCGLSILRV
ncbi:MAG: SMC-Scp complex subunit ScpB, partial [Lactobacillus iners]|nr:SMC-Scp complex subunit ScpB [Lactobacillus iners]